MTRRLLGLTALVAILAQAGCAAAPVDRSGADVLQLRMATIDGYEFGSTGGSQAGPETFVRELESLSGGRIEVNVATAYGSGAADAENRLVSAIAAGDLDGGFPATRAFAAAGIHGLEAVEAPFALVNRAAVAELVTGDVAALALAQLRGSGVVGVGLADGGLRRPFADRPLLGVPAWSDMRFRVFGSPVEADTVTALGGVPVPAGAGWVDDAVAGRLDGAEFSLEGYLGNDYSDEAGEVSLDVVLWPKVWVLALSQERFNSLDDEERSWVAEAAARATAASLSAPDDQQYVAGLCARGVHFHVGTPGQHRGLERAVASVRDGLRADPDTAELMAAVDDIASRHPTADVPRVPDDCGASSSLAGPEVPDEVSALPDGVYRAEVPASAVTAAGGNNGPGYSGLWTLEVKDGTYALTCRPLAEPGKDCGNAVSTNVLEAGRLRGADDRAYFVGDLDLLASLSGCSTEPGAAYACTPANTYAARWSVDGDELTFSDVLGPDGTYLGLRRWTRIGSTG